MIQFSDQEIAGARLVLDSKTELYYLGHNLTLRNCTIVLRVATRALVIAAVRFVDCVIDVKQEPRNFSWTDASLKGCRFHGRLSGSDFGLDGEISAGTAPSPAGRRRPARGPRPGG